MKKLSRRAGGLPDAIGEYRTALKCLLVLKCGLVKRQSYLRAEDTQRFKFRRRHVIMRLKNDRAEL